MVDAPPAMTRDTTVTQMRALKKRPHLFISVFVLWGLSLAWFHPRMWSLTELAASQFEFASIAYFVVFAELAWLYGIYNIAIVAFAIYVQRTKTAGVVSAAGAVASTAVAPLDPANAPPIAVLYTTCNDFVERSAESCVHLDYPNYLVYMLDDSSDPAAMARVDAFAAQHPDKVKVIRRANRQGFKAGNLNHALAHVSREPFFAVVDADEILPRNFLSALLPRLQADPQVGFVQANHRSRPNPDSALGDDMGVGVDIHWKWYQPLRNDFGFVMFLGHGALLRRSCWDEVQGFPEIVSEDLAYAIAIRERGYHGVFAEDVVCLEEFPETVRAFRIRHVKWTRGTCEFLHRWMGRLLSARNITTTEKLDILFPTLNLPLTFFFFLFMINSQVLFMHTLGDLRDVTWVMFGAEFVTPILTPHSDVGRIFGVDFYFITMMTVFAPVLCFMLALWRAPLRLMRFLAHSTTLYAALSPLSFISVIGYAITRRARFLVTGDVAATHAQSGAGGTGGAGAKVMAILSDTHPDRPIVRGFEVFMGLTFLATAIASFQIGFLGLSIAFILLPLMHRLGWEHPAIQVLKWAPFALLVLGLAVGSLGVAGMQPVFFGFGFHF